MMDPDVELSPTTSLGKKTASFMNKEAYDESNIDPVDRCAGSDHRGLFKH